MHSLRERLAIEPLREVGGKWDFRDVDVAVERVRALRLEKSLLLRGLSAIPMWNR